MRTTTIGIVVLLAGCAGKNGTEAGKDLVSAFCGKAAECCSDGEIRAILGPATSSSNCADRLMALASTSSSGISATLPRLGAAIQLPNTTYLDQAIRERRLVVDDDMLKRCVDLIDAIDCLPPDAGPAGARACTPSSTSTACNLGLIFKGQVAPGNHCLRQPGFPGFEECQAGSFCLDLGDGGVCVALGEVGDSCTTNSGCRVDAAPNGEKLFCDQLTGTCQRQRTLGQSCVVRNAGSDPVRMPCVSPLTCDPLSEICVAECARGHTCASDSDCDATQGLSCVFYSSSQQICDQARQAGQPCGAGDDCAAGLRCAPDTDPLNSYLNVCAPKLANDVAGCGSNADCLSGFCDASGAVRTCRAQVAPPGACPTGLDAQCQNGYCAALVCTPLVGDGGTCAADDQCQSGSCGGTKCARPPLLLGTTCSSNTQCASNFCNYETPRVCDQRPLVNGKHCAVATDCTSGVCLVGVCADGLPAGADCTFAAGKPPCAPAFFCDTTLTPQACQPRHGPGDDCNPSLSQCYGSCLQVAGSQRFVCDTTPPPGGVVCRGNGGQP